MLATFLKVGASQQPEPNFSSVSLLFHGDGTNGAQNNTFIDGSTNNFTMTRSGAPTQGSFSPYGDLWSNYFDGNGDYFSVPDNDVFNFGSGNFTIECFVNPKTLLLSRIYSQQGVSGTGLTFLRMLDGGAIQFSARNSSGTILANLTTPTNIAVGVWTHIAVVRESNIFSIYLNGALSVTSAAAVTLPNISEPVFIGAYSVGPAEYFNGYISNLRVVKGTAIYSSTFTPPTSPLTAVSGTSLLICQSNRFIDNSSNNFTLTISGNVAVQRFSPFAPSVEYSTSTIGGSGYFDGVGDYLGAPSNVALAPGSGVFTWECWFYPTVSWDQTPTSGDTLFITEVSSGLQIGRPRIGDGNFWGLCANAVGWQLTSTTLPIIGQWNHMAVVRSGTGTNQTALFLNGVRIAQGTVTTTFAQGLSYVMDGTSAGAAESTGFLSDMRLLKGTALYDPASATYTVPTAPLTAVANTSILLNFTNAGIFDNAMLNDWSTLGAAQISTTIKKFGTGSLYFDGGSTTRLYHPYSPLYDFATDNFTFEAWVYPTRASTTGTRIFSTGGGVVGWNSTNGIQLLIQTSGGTTSGGTLDVQIATNTASPTGVTNSTIVPINQWSFISVCVLDSIMYVGVNGSVVSGSVATRARPSANPDVNVGALVGESTSVLSFQGYIDELRLTQGVARYTSSFVPPTAAFPNT